MCLFKHASEICVINFSRLDSLWDELSTEYGDWRPLYSEQVRALDASKVWKLPSFVILMRFRLIQLRDDGFCLYHGFARMLSELGINDTHLDIRIKIANEIRQNPLKLGYHFC